MHSAGRLWNQQKPAMLLDRHHQHELPTANTIANPTPAKRAATVQITHEHTFIFKMHQQPPHSYNQGAMCIDSFIVIRSNTPAN